MVIDENYVKEHKDEIIREILAGKIFIYPTDTIYGIGCNALLNDSVLKIRQLKQREIKPFSVIAPSMKWVEENCGVDDAKKNELRKLPGPYTFFLRLLKPNAIAEDVNPLENGTVGVRIPKHWFIDIIAEAGVPFVTTSVNIRGRPYMTSLEELDEIIKNNVDFIIYEGEKKGRESMKINLTM